MSILVRRINGNTFETITGQMRLQTSLSIHGKASVTDVETEVDFEVHMVDGELVVLASAQDAVAETLAVAAIVKASSVICPLCDGNGGWPGPNGRVPCRPCKGRGKELPES